MIQNFRFYEQKIKGVFELFPFYMEDERGSFTKDYSLEILKEQGLRHELKEVFYTKSHKGVIRGLHFQREYQQAKLVRCIQGHVCDIVVDLRKDSPTFREYLSFDLTEENRREILVPAGCAHGYYVKQESIVSYKCAEKFYGEFDDGILWNDPDLNINWNLEVDPREVILSEKDRKLQSFQQFMNKYGGF